MSKHCRLLKLRKKLDKAITYGTKKQARKLAKYGLKEAQERGFQDEAEYFSGQQELLKDNFVSAIEHFSAAVKLNPFDGGSYNDWALCLAELGLIDEALKYFDKGIKIEPDYATIYHNKGWLLNNIGRYQEALRCLRKALKLEPGRPVTYDNLADCLYNLGDLAGAKKAYEKVLKLLDPQKCRSIARQIRKRIQELEQRLQT